MSIDIARVQVLRCLTRGLLVNWLEPPDDAKCNRRELQAHTLALSRMKSESNQ